MHIFTQIAPLSIQYAKIKGSKPPVFRLHSELPVSGVVGRIIRPLLFPVMCFSL